ncbi:MAG: tetratricopeptide repeat protein, partial [Bacteroidaceae bacterium]|nr:tetratricopeptide repeat protein [Bacteroidaceae bacterium]
MKSISNIKYILVACLAAVVANVCAQQSSMALRNKEQAEKMVEQQQNAQQSDEQATNTKPTKYSPKSSRNNLRSGNKLYNSQKYLESEIDYRRAADFDPESAAASYNLGNSLYRQEKFDEAGKCFDNATSMTDDKQLQAQAYHNMGNILMQQQK